MKIPVDGAARAFNQLLACLKAEQYRILAPQLERVHLRRKQVVAERGAPAAYVYFPCGSVLSVLAYMQNGAAVEVGTIGREGFFGLEVLLGASRWTETTLCQVEGPAMRMSAAAFSDAISGDSVLRRLAQRYLLAYIALVSQSVACNRLHKVEERFARWVLMTHDRVDGDSFYLTQEFIADMLGVHRPGVSLVAGAFQQAGFLKYSRGHMVICNRQGLEKAACECYASGEMQLKQIGLHLPLPNPDPNSDPNPDPHPGATLQPEQVTAQAAHAAHATAQTAAQAAAQIPQGGIDERP